MQAKLTTRFPLKADHLAVVGPIVEVVIHHDLAYWSGERESPDKSVTGWAILDTGASQSALSGETARLLALPVAATAMAAGFSGTAVYEQRSAFIRLPDLETTQRGEFLISEALPPTLVAILGRSFLRHFKMTYDGRTGEVTIENGRPGVPAKVVNIPAT